MSQYEQMREAITKAEAVIDGTRMMVLQGQEYDIGLLDFDGALKMLRAALAKPPRNCDAGTPDEQSERFTKYCKMFPRCRGCECCGKVLFGRCELAWAQMPYEQEGENNG